jgi:hypothetical protein
MLQRLFSIVITTCFQQQDYFACHICKKYSSKKIMLYIETYFKHVLHF